MNGANAEGKAAIRQNKMRPNRTRIALLGTVFVLAMIVLVFYLAAGLFDMSPPFPSGDTPLTRSGEGVLWGYRATDYFSNLQTPFSNASFFIAYPGEWGTTFEKSHTGYASGTFNASRVLFDDHQDFDYADAGSFLISGKDTAQGVVWSTFWILINDSDSNGRWGPGDELVIFSCSTLNGTVIKEGFMEDTEYAVGIEFPPVNQNAGMISEWHFAFHKGKLYSWLPDKMLMSFW